MVETGGPKIGRVRKRRDEITQAWRNAHTLPDNMLRNFVTQHKCGTVSAGTLKDGLPHGLVTVTHVNGMITKLTYKDGERHGPFSHTSLDGTVLTGVAVNDVQHGPFTETRSDGKIIKGFFVHGQRQGPYSIADAGTVMCTQ